MTTIRITLFARVISLILVSSIASIMTGCGSDIPDDPGGKAPSANINNITTIGATFEKTSANDNRVRINLLGILHPVTGKPIEFAANKNIWITEDDVLKGIKITSAGSDVVLSVDIVFVVDNSGSMGQESDSIASKIISFAKLLEESGINVRVGSVGQNNYVTGALNLASAADLEKYLSRRGTRQVKGTYRTIGFGGPDSAKLAAETKSSFFKTSIGGENSIRGIVFADSLFSWRPNANRVYIVFTDEPTAVGRNRDWSAEWLYSRWSSEKGTIHTVFSEDTLRIRWSQWYERPWELSRLTGGTMKFISNNASDLDLTNLPVTLMVANSVLIEFISANSNARHNLTITVKGGESADGVKEFWGIVY